MRSTLLLAAALVGFSAAGSAATFEGKVDFTVQSGTNPPQNIVYEVRGGQVRMEVGAEGKSAVLLIDGDKQTMTVVIDQQRMYFTRPLPPMGPGTEGGPGNIQPKTGGIQPTGETTTLLGYKCTKYTASDGAGGTTSIWVTSELGNFMGFGGMAARGKSRGLPGSTPPPGWEEALMGKGFFPLKVEGSSHGTSFKLSATAVHKETVPASDFAVPAGYRDLSGMMGAMGR